MDDDSSCGGGSLTSNLTNEVLGTTSVALYSQLPACESHSNVRRAPAKKEKDASLLLILLFGVQGTTGL